MEWTRGWRARVWNELDQKYDVLIIGGGITGAGILRECVHAGLRTLLVEADDFASGTSSRSSKLVHGGLRYLRNAQFKVTLESVRERELLLKQGRGLVNRLGFLHACLDSDHVPGWIFGAGLIVYDIMAGEWSHRSYDVDEMHELCPTLTTPALRGGYRYFDANTDDARLVLRLLRESVDGGGSALNYARVESLLQTRDRQVCGAVVMDASGEAEHHMEVRARVVINATGAWADEMRVAIRRKHRLRPLRGSHLVLPIERLPLTRAVSFMHPKDGRPVFALPWEGAVVFGTTDVDHGPVLQTDPCISSPEAEYLLSGLQQIFPSQELSLDDVLSTYAGLRPVVDTGKADPSKESREHAIWDENNLLTVSGGKLTTFRIMARDALKEVSRQLGHIPFKRERPVLEPIPFESEVLLAKSTLPPAQRLRLLARYGTSSAALFSAASSTDLESVPATPYFWSELRQAARAEGVIHLDDLLMRRVRLGLLVPHGGIDLLPRIRAIVQPELGWDDARWDEETRQYTSLWRSAYCPG
ncbi:MAG: FAD-dependent oxidoreductase [Anaerolineales bacterium]|nr:glycerol-3-phosphate dehydrogenase/oxidase [Anaerolineae bacterium]PWB71873.1 MAG: FAD-dependent oxidoreductase [Anaerolineales bacterium]